MHTMILSGKEILKRKDQDIIIEPFNENQVNPNSYNLKLHNELMVYENSPLDMKENNSAKKIIIRGYIIFFMLQSIFCIFLYGFFNMVAIFTLSNGSGTNLNWSVNNLLVFNHVSSFFWRSLHYL